MRHARILVGDVRERLRELPEASVQAVVTSPPYWRQREYGVAGQIGLEPQLDCLGWARGDTCPDCYVCALRSCFSEVLRVTNGRGTLWLNLGDTYPNDAKWGGQSGIKDPAGRNGAGAFRRWRFSGLKAKNLGMVPARIALALQTDGWHLRRDVIWHKPNARPEGAVVDRPTTAHEYVWMLSKSPDAYYDAKAIGEPASESYQREIEQGYEGEATRDYAAAGVQDPSATKKRIIDAARRRIARDGFLWVNARSVWTIPTEASDVEHYAVMPEALAERCILAGSREGDVVLDPFAGAGTTGVVALRRGREFVGIELNPAYAALAEKRIHSDAALFNRVEVSEPATVYTPSGRSLWEETDPA